MDWDDVDAGLLQRTLARLHDALPDQRFEVSESIDGDRIVSLLKASRADYSFEFWIYCPNSGGSGGRYIGATLPGRPARESFWGCPFEPEAFLHKRSTRNEARERLADAFDEWRWSLFVSRVASSRDVG